MPQPKEKAWFTAKSFGWGWTTPMRWQGWVVSIGFVAGLFAGMLFFVRRPIAYVVYVLCQCAILIGVCYWKGEKTHWRSGTGE